MQAVYHLLPNVLKRPERIDIFGFHESPSPKQVVALNQTVHDNVTELPKTFGLAQNYPNPFNPTTTIEFSVPKTEFVTLKIYNLLGQEVANLVSEKLTAGKYKYDWDAGRLASGVYLYQLKTDQGFSQTRKLILMK